MGTGVRGRPGQGLGTNHRPGPWHRYGPPHPARHRRRRQDSSKEGARYWSDPWRSTTIEPPSKTSSSWPPTRLRYTTGTREAAASRWMWRARWASLEIWNGGTVDVEQDLRPGVRLPAGKPDRRVPRCPRRSTRPRSPHRCPRPTPGLGTRREVAVLVEHPVVGQQHLVVYPPDTAPVEQRHCVRHVPAYRIASAFPTGGFSSDRSTKPTTVTVSPDSPARRFPGPPDWRRRTPSAHHQILRAGIPEWPSSGGAGRRRPATSPTSSPRGGAPRCSRDHRPAGLSGRRRSPIVPIREKSTEGAGESPGRPTVDGEIPRSQRTAAQTIYPFPRALSRKGPATSSGSGMFPGRRGKGGQLLES